MIIVIVSTGHGTPSLMMQTQAPNYHPSIAELRAIAWQQIRVVIDPVTGQPMYAPLAFANFNPQGAPSSGNA